MAIYDNYQWPLTLVKRIRAGDLVAGTAKEVHLIPPGAVVISGTVSVITAFDSVGTATLSIGDAAAATRYTATPANIKATAGTTVAATITGFRHAAPTPLRFLLTEGAGATAENGEVIVTLTLVMEGRDTEWVS